MSKIRQLVRELGTFPALCYAADRAWERLFGRRLCYLYAIVAQPVTSPRMRASKKIDVRECSTWTDLARFVAQMETPEPVIRRRFDEGYVCLALIRDGECLAYAWLALDGYREDEVRCLFQPLPAETTGWDFDVYVTPEKRGTLLFARLWDAVNSYYLERGRRSSLSRISRFNRASIDSHRSLGAVELANALFVVLGPLQLMLADCGPYLHLSLSDASAPRLRVAAPASGDAAS